MISEAIAAIERSRPGMLSPSETIALLSSTDHEVYSLYSRHALCPAAHFTGYTEDTPGDTLLLIPDQYSDIYLHRLEAKADYDSGEIDRYNCSSALFNAEWERFERFWRGSHRPLSGKWRLE